MKSLLFKIISLSPILALTRDENYGFNEKGYSPELRFSLINLRLGKVTYYFITFIRKESTVSFDAKKKLTLDECQWNAEGEGLYSEKNSYINDLSKKYADGHLATIGEQDQKAEKEFILYLINNLEQRKALSYQKMNYYTAIVLVVLPLIPTFLVHIFSLAFASSIFPYGLSIFLSGILGCCLVNWCLLVLQYISVTGIPKSSFKEIKTPSETRPKEIQLLYSYYHDWQQERFDTNLRVAYVKNTEIFVKICVCLIVLLLTVSTMANVASSSVTSTQNNGIGTVYSIDTTGLGEPFSAESVTMAQVHATVKAIKPETLIVFVGESTEVMDIVNDNIDQYQEYIDVIVYIDCTLKPSEFKITWIGA